MLLPRVFNQKVEQITAEHTVTLDQNKTVINSLKSEVNRLTQNNAKLESRVTVNIAPNKADVPTQPAHQQSLGYQTPVGMYIYIYIYTHTHIHQ